MSKPLLCPANLLKKDMTGQRVVITGANSGIGWVTARQLAKQGAQVTMACRRLEEGQTRAREISAEYQSADLEVRALDLSSLSSVRAFAEAYLRDHDELHVLINNAGVMNTKEGKTEDGFETQIGVNHLGHFLLVELLKDRLINSAPSRVVVLSSCYHDKAMGHEGIIDLDDLHFEKRKYNGWTAYAQSKLANLLHAKSLAHRLEGDGVTVVSVHPGWVRTNLGRHTAPSFVQNILLRPVFSLMGQIDTWQGAQTSLYAALSDELESGAYYSQTGVYRDKSKNAGGWPLISPNPNAHDDALAEALYEHSLSLVS